MANQAAQAIVVFKEPRLKVERAKKHVADLNREFLIFKRSDPYRIVVDRNSKPGYHLLRIVEDRKPSIDWPVIIGDVLHNLSSGLDILACDIARTLGRTNVRAVYFPFAESACALEHMIKKRKMNKTRPNIVNEFRRLKPYKGGDGTLYAIHDMNIRDKHKLLIAMSQPAAIRHPRVLRPDGTIIMDSHVDTFITLLDKDRILFTALAADNLKFEYERKVPFQILFDIGAVNLKPVIPTLHQMTKLVDEIISIFEGHFNNPQPTIALGYLP